MHRRLIILLICLIFADYADTHIYKERYTNSSDILFTYDGKHMYRGRYTNSSDIILTYGGPVPVPFLMMGVL